MSMDSLQAPPTGVVSNLLDPPDQQAGVLAATSCILILSTLFVVLRCYTRTVLTDAFGLSDCTSLF